jgi:hypothetical protein
MIIDIGDLTGWVAEWDISQVFIKFGMGSLNDGELIGRDIFERIVPIV